MTQGNTVMDRVDRALPTIKEGAEAFLARQNPLAVVPVAIMFGALAASGGLIQWRMGMPDATILVPRGFTATVGPYGDLLLTRAR